MPTGRFCSDKAYLLPSQREAQARAAIEYKADLQAQIDDKRRRKVRPYPDLRQQARFSKSLG